MEKCHYASFLALPSFQNPSSSSSSSSTSSPITLRRLRFTSDDVDDNLLLKDRPTGFYGLPADVQDLKALFVFATDEAQHVAAELCEDYKKKTRGELVIAGGF